MIARRTWEITASTGGPSEKACKAAEAAGVPEDRSGCPDKADGCLGTGGRPSLEDMCHIVTLTPYRICSRDEKTREVTGVFGTRKSVLSAATLNRSCETASRGWN